VIFLIAANSRPVLRISLTLAGITSSVGSLPSVRLILLIVSGSVTLLREQWRAVAPHGTAPHCGFPAAGRPKSSSARFSAQSSPRGHHSDIMGYRFIHHRRRTAQFQDQSGRRTGRRAG